MEIIKVVALLSWKELYELELRLYFVRNSKEMEYYHYKFDQFYVKNGQLLTKENRAIYLAPKENSVLLFMLESANTVIAKDDIINHVWKGGIVSDESLTRCIYVLRRALGHTNKRRIIENVYGKGYRFVPPVELIGTLSTTPLQDSTLNVPSRFADAIRLNAVPLPKQDAPQNVCSIALFHFDMKQKALAASLHDQLVDWLHCLHLPINVVSSFFTRGCQDYGNYMLAIEKSQADYYISGVEIGHSEKSIIRLELTRAKDHTVLNREGVQLTSDYHINYRLLCRAILTLLSRVTSERSINTAVVQSAQASVQGIQHDALQFSISELKKTMPNPITPNEYNDNSISELSRIAVSYYAIANLGLMDYERVRTEMILIVSKILVIEPNNVIAISLQGLLLCAENNQEASSKFHLAMLLSPSVAEVYYYYACHLVRRGDFSKALQMNNMCMELNDSYYSSKILHVIIHYMLGDIPQAIKYGEAALKTESPGNTVMSGLMALIYARLGELCKARALARNIEKHKLSCEFMSYCYNEVVGVVQSDIKIIDSNTGNNMTMNNFNRSNSFFLASWIM